MFVGPGGAAAQHAHHAVQLVWSLDGEFTVTLEQPVLRHATLIPAGVAHALDTTGRRIIMIFAEPHGSRGASLDRRARACLGAEVVDDLASIRFPDLGLDVEEAGRWCDGTLAALGADEQLSALSSISRRAIAYVESAIGGKPQLAEAARRAGVSPTRLTHVFSREVGIPFRRFVLWSRLRQAVLSTQAGHDLTEAALAAGFSDSAHLSRTFRAMFGLSPSLVLPLAEIVGSLSPDCRGAGVPARCWPGLHLR